MEPAAGEFAFAYNRDAIKVSNTAPIKQVGLGAQRISPITKMTAEKLQKFQGQYFFVSLIWAADGATGSSVGGRL